MGSSQSLSASMKKEKWEEMYEGYRNNNFPLVPEITAAALAKRLDSDPSSVILVDCRFKSEQNVSIIPGAVSQEAFVERGFEFEHMPDDTIVVAYCTIGYRSGLFAKKCMLNGDVAAASRFVVYNLKGSVLAWAHENRSFLDPNGEATKRVHVFASTWDLLPDDFKGVTFGSWWQWWS